MNQLSREDLAALRKGLPPVSTELIKHLCIDHEWLRQMKDYCLDKVIQSGGSKVKILYGSKATGKSHFMHYLRNQADESGFFCVYLNLQEAEFFLSDPVELYKAVAHDFEPAELGKTLIHQVLLKLGYRADEYDACPSNLNSFICERENSNAEEAKRLIRIAINHVINEIGVDFAFRKFLHVFCEAAVSKNAEITELCIAWLKGEKIDRISKTLTGLYETLNRSNARIWLYSLTELILLSGFTGLVVLIDQFEAVLPLSSSRMRYTPTRRNDVFELLRQLIDDLDFFHHTLFLIAGDEKILSNEHFGLQSYHALWMRIQPGFSRNEGLNPYADLVDTNAILAEANQKGEFRRLSDKLKALSQHIPGSARTDIFQDEDFYPDFRHLIQNSLNLLSTEGETDDPE